MPSSSRVPALLCLLLIAALAVVALPAPAARGADVDALRDRERSLAGGAARLGSLITRARRQLDVIEGRRSGVQAELAADERRLAAIRRDLRSERARLVRLRARLAQGRRALRARLLALYKAPPPDLSTIVLSSTDFAELYERTTFLRRVRDQDQRIVGVVRAARGDADRGVRAAARAEARAAEVVVGVRARRDALASMARAAGERRATLAQARSVRLAALSATRASRQGVERRIRRLEAAEARAAQAARARTARASRSGGDGGGVSGGWAIPAAIVECESGGQNLPPNAAGASGYYQIVPGTWKLNGGSGPAAWKASRAEQDRVAARIWDGGAGASQWVCAALG